MDSTRRTIYLLKCLLSPRARNTRLHLDTDKLALRTNRRRGIHMWPTNKLVRISTSSGRRSTATIRLRTVLHGVTCPLGLHRPHFHQITPPRRLAVEAYIQILTGGNNYRQTVHILVTCFTASEARWQSACLFCRQGLLMIGTGAGRARIACHKCPNPGDY